MSTSIQSSAASNVHAPQKVDGNAPNGQGVDVMMLAVYYLLQSASITCTNELIRSKSLSQNAQSQEQLNQLQGQENFMTMPSEAVTKQVVKYDPHTYWTWNWDKHHEFHVTTYKYKNIYNVKNQGAIDNVQAQNQQVSALRQIMSDKQNVLGQDAQVKTTGISTEADLTSQVIQMGGSLLQIIQTLSFNASLRQPVQG